jgi:hypothetical protein
MLHLLVGVDARPPKALYQVPWFHVWNGFWPPLDELIGGSFSEIDFPPLHAFGAENVDRVLVWPLDLKRPELTFDTNLEVFRPVEIVSCEMRSLCYIYVSLEFTFPGAMFSDNFVIALAQVMS